MSDHPYSAADVAEMLGHSVGWLYRHYRTLVDHFGMPAAIVPIGRYRFRREQMDRWLAARKNPAFNNAAANDDGALDWREELAREYAHRTDTAFLDAQRESYEAT